MDDGGSPCLKLYSLEWRKQMIWVCEVDLQKPRFYLFWQFNRVGIFLPLFRSQFVWWSVLLEPGIFSSRRRIFCLYRREVITALCRQRIDLCWCTDYGARKVSISLHRIFVTFFFGFGNRPMIHVPELHLTVGTLTLVTRTFPMVKVKRVAGACSKYAVTTLQLSMELVGCIWLIRSSSGSSWGAAGHERSPWSSTKCSLVSGVSEERCAVHVFILINFHFWRLWFPFMPPAAELAAWMHAICCPYPRLSCSYSSSGHCSISCSLQLSCWAACRISPAMRNF